MAQPPAPPPPVPPDGVAGEEHVSAYGAALDAMAELLRDGARAWAAKVRRLVELDDLVAVGAARGAAQFPELEMAGSWQVSQITAGRWVADAVRLTTALPRTLAVLEAGELFEHQAKVLLHRTRNCTEEVARAVEQAVLPAGAALYPSDLAERVDRAVLRIGSEQEGAVRRSSATRMPRPRGAPPGRCWTAWRWPGGADGRAAGRLQRRTGRPGAA